MMYRGMILWMMCFCFGFVIHSAYGGEKEIKPKPISVLAGMGLISSKHSCTKSLEVCNSDCVKTGGTDCELECASDCNVCALDFGEESLRVCRR